MVQGQASVAGAPWRRTLRPPTGDRLYLFEFKVVEQAPDGRALAQLQARGYAEKYREPGASIMLVGIEFSREERNVVGFEVAKG